MTSNLNSNQSRLTQLSTCPFSLTLAVPFVKQLSPCEVSMLGNRSVLLELTEKFVVVLEQSKYIWKKELQECACVLKIACVYICTS